MDRRLALLLDYPDGSVDAGAAPREFAEWWARTPLPERQARYVADFDLRGGTSLYLTYHRFGDDRARGRALIALKRLYREAGWELDHWELPDYLPLVVELAAEDPEVGQGVLDEYREELARIAASLRRAGSPWAPVVEAVAA